MVRDIGRQAYSALRFNKRRSLLTMLGMAWGIATVVLLLAYGSGFQRGLMVAFRTFGGNLIAIFPGRTSLQAGGSKAGTQVRLTTDDLEYLRAEVPMIRRIAPEANKQSLIAYGTRAVFHGDPFGAAGRLALAGVAAVLGLGYERLALDERVKRWIG